MTHPHQTTLARMHGVPTPSRWILHYASNAWGWVPALERPYHEWEAPPPELAPPPGLRLLGVARSERGRVRLGLVGPELPPADG